MSRARTLADYVSSGDELADKAPKASPTFTGTVAIPNIANLETAVTANTAKVTNATHTGDVTGSTTLTIANDAVDSQHYAAGSIDNEHLADDAVGTDELANDVVINTSGNITTTGSGTITSAGHATFGGKIIMGSGSYMTGEPTSGIRLNDSADSINILICENAGDVKVPTGDLYFGTAGKGVVLGATSNVDANTLNDYEEGTWTPTWTYSNTTTDAPPTSTSTSAGTGNYVKVGNVVTAVFPRVSIADGDLGTGVAILGNVTLPFAASGTAAAQFYGYNINGKYGSSTFTTGQLSGATTGGSNLFLFYTIHTTATGGGYFHFNATNSFLYSSITYMTT